MNFAQEITPLWNSRKIYNWMFSWLTKRTQWVVIKGHSLTYGRVDSSVPQGRVSRQLMFLLYIMTLVGLLS